MQLQCSSFMHNWNIALILWWFSFLLQVVSHVCYKNHFWPTTLFKSIWGFNIFISFFLIPIVLIYCYGVIAWILTRRMDFKLSSSSSSDTFQVARTNTIKTFLTVALCLVLCWSSIQIYYLMCNIGYEIDWNSTFYISTVFMMFPNSTVNPLIYVIKYKDFQVALWYLLCPKESAPQKAS